MGRLVFSAVFFATTSAFSGQSVTLAWDPNSEADLAGYKLYYGTASRSYGATVSVTRPLTTATVSNLVEGQTYFFAVTAVTTDLLESDYSDEVSYRVPTGLLNSAPIALDGTAQTMEEQPVSIVLRGTDADSDPLIYSVIAAPSQGTLTGTPPNLVYQPNPNQYGADSFVFRVFDGKTNSEVATVSLRIDPVTDAPIAHDDSLSTTPGVPLTLTASQLLSNDWDPDGGDVLSVAAVESTSLGGGTLIFAAGIITYTPKEGATGSDGFAYTIRDLSGLTSSARVHLNANVPVDASGPVISGWNVAGKDARSTLMKWATDEPAHCVVEYGTTSALGDHITTSHELLVSHSFLLEWLEPNTTYLVRLRAMDSAGNTSVSGIATITTPEVTTFSWAAESGMLDGPMAMDLIDTALDDAYILSSTNGWGTVTYPVQVDVRSNYRIWCRLWAPAPGRGSFRVSVDNEPADIFDAAEMRWIDSWQWVLVNGRNGIAPMAVNPRLFPLNPGAHQIRFQTHEAETFLDHVILSNDPDFSPGIQGTSPVLTATATGPNQILLTWTDNISNEDGFQLQWSSDGVNFEPVAILPRDATQFDHTDLAAPGTYHYRIYAFTPWDRTEYSNVSIAPVGNLSRLTEVPQGPPYLDAEVIGRRRVKLNWVDVSNNEGGFLLERSTDGVVFNDAQVFGPNITVVEDRPPSRGWFYYRVRAFNEAGNSNASNTDLVWVE